MIRLGRNVLKDIECVFTNTRWNSHERCMLSSSSFSAFFLPLPVVLVRDQLKACIQHHFLIFELRATDIQSSHGYDALKITDLV